MIRLSERNLLTLLYGLETYGTRHLRKPGQGLILAETDEKHYDGREYGQMPVEIEAFIARMRVVAQRIEQQVNNCDQNPPEWALTAARVIAGDFANSPEVVGIAHVISKYAHEAGAW